MEARSRVLTLRNSTELDEQRRQPRRWHQHAQQPTRRNLGRHDGTGTTLSANCRPPLPAPPRSPDPASPAPAGSTPPRRRGLRHHPPPHHRSGTGQRPAGPTRPSHFRRRLDQPDRWEPHHRSLRKDGLCYTPTSTISSGSGSLTGHSDRPRWTLRIRRGRREGAPAIFTRPTSGSLRFGRRGVGGSTEAAHAERSCLLAVRGLSLLGSQSVTGRCASTAHEDHQQVHEATACGLVVGGVGVGGCAGGTTGGDAEPEADAQQARLHRYVPGGAGPGGE